MYANLIAAAALLAAPLVSATGSAIVQNQCTFPVYIWSVASTSNAMVTVPAGKTYSETYRTNSNGGGISIKIAAEPDVNAGITQFEYTLAGTIWYDISNINGYPFMKWGVSLVPSLATCPVKNCRAGIEKCTDAYNVYNDDTATADCNASADLVLELCNNGGAAVPSVSSTAAAVSTTLITKVSSSAKASTSSVLTSTSTARQTSTTVTTVGTTFITRSSSASASASASSSAVKSSSSTVVPVVTVTAAPASSTTANNNPGEVVITTYVTSWTTVDGSEPTAAPASRTQDQDDDDRTNTWWHGRHTHAARAERHQHRHAREIVA